MKSSVITWDVSLPHRLNTHKHTHTPMSSIPLPLYNLGTIFIWCYWVKLDGFLYSCGYSEELAKYVYQTFRSMKQSNSFMLTAYVKTATLSVSVKHIKATMPYLLDWSGGGFFFSFFFSVCVCVVFLKIWVIGGWCYFSGTLWSGHALYMKNSVNTQKSKENSVMCHLESAVRHLLLVSQKNK